MDDKLTMTVSEAAIALKISRGLAYSAAQDGRLPCIRIGRRLLIRRRALEKILAEPQPLNLRTVANDRK